MTKQRRMQARQEGVLHKNQFWLKLQFSLNILFAQVNFDNILLVVQVDNFLLVLFARIPVQPLLRLHGDLDWCVRLLASDFVLNLKIKHFREREQRSIFVKMTAKWSPWTSHKSPASSRSPGLRPRSAGGQAGVPGNNLLGYKCFLLILSNVHHLWLVNEPVFIGLVKALSAKDEETKLHWSNFTSMNCIGTPDSSLRPRSLSRS